MDRQQSVSFFRLCLVALLALPVPSSLGQNTCYTNPHGTTICIHAGSVIHGNTNSAGQSVYRDDRGNRLDFQTDAAGNASVKPREGDPIQWSQPVLGEQKYPDGSSTVPPPPPLVVPGGPGSGRVPRVAPRATESAPGPR